MNQYIATHHNGKNTSFFPVSTVDDAREQLIYLLNTRQIGLNDALSIVETVSDQLVYYKAKNNTVNSIEANKIVYKPILEQIGQYLKNRLAMLLGTK
ncbi:hypothetical protein [Spirosoma montaniterrae]|nr:hypothetical protein [Spirosoma montaniterrae]